MNRFKAKYWAVAPAVLAGLVLLGGTNAWPHGGDDHGAAALGATAAPLAGAPIVVPKEVQFLAEVRTARVKQTTRAEQRRALGTVTTPTARQAKVHSPFSGRVLPEERLAARGDTVEKGQVIARVEQSTDVSSSVALKTEIARAEADLAEAREATKLAAAEAARVEKLGDAAAGKRRQESASALATARQRAEGLERALEELRDGMRTGEGSTRVVSLTAPIGGVIAATAAVSGEYISAETVLFEIVDPAEVWVEAEIYEMDLGLLQGTATAVALTDAFPTERFSGSLVSVGTSVDPATRTVKAVFGVDNARGLLRDGMALDVFIASARERTGLLVPKASIIHDGPQTSVYVKEAPEVFKAHPVKVAVEWDDAVLVEGGLEDGEIVAVQGIYQIRMSALNPIALPATAPGKAEHDDHGHDHNHDHKEHDHEHAH